ncbi:MAG: LuxR family transcriptional regulator, partial [Deltaproteobacteria bacterium]|nr:LuxR family transcriptional regulator [Deltaproteobacteria bacterium]
QRAVTDVLRPAGIEDIMVVNAIDPVGVGCWIGAPIGQRRELAGAERERWNRVATHVRSALRLRLRLSNSEPERSKAPVEAVLARDGKVAHAEKAAEAHLDALRDAVIGVDRARSTLRDAPDRALPSWKAMVRARWTLVDDFQRDGSRYVLARVNVVETQPIDQLSARERQVVACLSLGFTYKETAYELGLSASTVRVLVVRACAKLGVATREELVLAYRKHSMRGA